MNKRAELNNLKLEIESINAKIERNNKFLEYNLRFICETLDRKIDKEIKICSKYHQEIRE